MAIYNFKIELMKSFFKLFLISIFLLSCKDPKVNTINPRVDDTIKNIHDSLLGKYEGEQKSYSLKNRTGKEVIVKGNKVVIPSSQFYYILRANNKIDLYQRNNDNYSIYNYPTVDYRVIEENDEYLTIEFVSFGKEYSNMTDVIKINKNNKTAICLHKHQMEPDFPLIKTDDLENNIDSVVPQEIEYYGKPGLEYSIDGKRAVLGVYISEGYFINRPENHSIRMKFSNIEMLLKNIRRETTRDKRVYRGNGYQVVFKFKKIECQGCHLQTVKGDVFIQTGEKHYSTQFEGYNNLFVSKQCLERDDQEC